MKKVWSNPKFIKLETKDVKSGYRACLDPSWPEDSREPRWDQNPHPTYPNIVGYWYCCSQGQAGGQPQEGYARCDYFDLDGRTCHLYDEVVSS